MTQAASFSDNTNSMNPFLQRSFRRHMEALLSAAANSNNNGGGLSLHNPLLGVNFFPGSMRLPSELEASYLSLLALQSPILSPIARQLLQPGNRSSIPPPGTASAAATPTNPSPRRNLLPPQAINQFPSAASQSSTSVGPSSNPTSSFRPLPKPHVVEETGRLIYSPVEGEKVMGFHLWGETRLCLPHLLRFVLYDVDIDEIGQALSKLRITCTKCSPKQLAMLHSCNALPSEVTSCGLIRKSDAERMLKYLRSTCQRPTLGETKTESEVEQTSSTELSENFIDVVHDCFGSQTGRAYPHLYTSETAPCIACSTCSKLFTPQDFVGHTHSVKESDGCCHWGFDSNSWRSYLRLDLRSPVLSKRVKRDDGKDEPSEVRLYRVLEDFKAKFEEVLRLPKGITKLAAGLETKPRIGGSSADSRKPVDSQQPLDCSTASKTEKPEVEEQEEPQDDQSEQQQQQQEEVTKRPASPVDPRLEVRLPPHFRIRRLWAPHRGRLRIPNPPKLISNCPRGPKPRNLSSGPPVLLDPSCIVTKDSAQLYGRDFIPNVCLKPISPPASRGCSAQLHVSRSLPSVPSNEDLVTSTATAVSSCSSIITEKRLSDAAMMPSYRGRPTIRGSAGGLPNSLSSDFSSFHHQQQHQGLNSIDSSPARARNSNSVHEVPLNLRKRSNTEAVLRCPSVDSIPQPSRGQLSRTTSDPEINLVSNLVQSGRKRERTGSWSLTPPSCLSPRRKRLLDSSRDEDLALLGKSAELRTSEACPISQFPKHQQNPNPQQQQQQQNWFSADVLAANQATATTAANTAAAATTATATTPEMLLNMATEANPRIPNIVAHWTSLYERIEQFCDRVAPSGGTLDDPVKRHFDLERQRLMADLNVIRERNFSDLSTVLRDNKKLWKLLTDALLLSASSAAPPPTLTPNTLAPPCGIIPGVTDMESIGRMMSLLQGFRSPARPSEAFRQSATMEIPDYSSSSTSSHHPQQQQQHQHGLGGARSPFWPLPDLLASSLRSGGSGSLSNGGTDSTARLNTSTPGGGGDFLLPSKRQRLFRHSYSSANSNLHP